MCPGSMEKKDPVIVVIKLSSQHFAFICHIEPSQPRAFENGDDLMDSVYRITYRIRIRIPRSNPKTNGKYSPPSDVPTHWSKAAPMAATLTKMMAL